MIKFETGKIYHSHEKGSDIEAIFKIIKLTDDDQPHVEVITTKGAYYKIVKIHIRGDVRPATSEETAWFNICSLKKQFMTKEDAIAQLLYAQSIEHAKRNEEGQFLPSFQSIDKEQKDLKFEDFYTGQKFTAKIREVKTEGRITVYEDRVYLCQNDKDGDYTQNKHSYKYSWVIWDKKKQRFDIESFGVENLKIENVYGKELKVFLPKSYKISVQIKPTNFTLENLKLEMLMDQSDVSGETITKLFQNKTKEKYYINIVGLEDNTDERIMRNFIEDLSFQGFSKIDSSPIFEIKDNDQTSLYWEELVQKINDTGATIKIIIGDKISDHLD